MPGMIRRACLMRKSGSLRGTSCTPPQSWLIAFGMPEEIGELDPLKASLASIAKNARSLLSDAELLLDHGRYARTAALAVLAIEEVGKFYLLKWDRTEAKQAMRYHPPKQRIVADVVAADSGLSMRMSARFIQWVWIGELIEDVTPAEQKWMDSQGGWDNFAQKLKSDTPNYRQYGRGFQRGF